MRIRITYQNYWYKDKVGQIFYVEKETEKSYKINSKHYVSKKDCKVLPDLKPSDLREGLKVYIRRDLEEGKDYGRVRCINGHTDHSGYIHRLNEYGSFSFEDTGLWYSVEMILYTEEEIAPAEPVKKKKNLTVNDLKLE